MATFGPLTFAHPSKHATGTEEYDFNQNEEVVCLFCSKQFTLPAGRSLFNSHLFECHHFMISDIQTIVSVKMYCDYWKSRFVSDAPDRVCSKMLSDAKIDGEKVACLVLGDFIPEDRRIREEIKNKRLVWALEQQARERDDKEFCRGCLLCRLKFQGTRSDYLNHLSVMHNMHIGRPENLVFIDNFRKMFVEMFLHCLYCNKLFKDRTVLKEHMRKKQHKKINPEHGEFDKFYIINYMEIGKNWQDLQNEMDEDPPAEENGDALSDKDWSDWEGEEDPVVCLFCDASGDFESCINHMLQVHSFNYSELCVKNKLNFYQQVKLVNYIRRQIHMGRCPVCNESHEQLVLHMAFAGHFILPDKQLWEQPEYFFPTYENDSFLCHLDDLQDDLSEIELAEQ
ncbi:hypothetical protein L9F63_022627, partial [Diploptera punctata]